MIKNNDTLPTPAEVDEFIANLSEQDAAELKRQRLVKAALDREAPKPAPNLGNMTDQEFAAYKRSLGIGS